jgi:hypothetical protein
MYMFELLAERLTGEPTVSFTSHWMDRGSELEAEAVSYYEMQADCDTEKVGFIARADGRIGASPDRLVGDDGLLEIKVCKPATHVGYLLKSGAAYEEHRIQTQGQLWVAEREWNDLLAYNPLLPPALYRAHRDEAFIALLSSAVEAFSTALETQYQLLIANGFVKQPKERSAPTMTEILRQSLIERNREAELHAG